MRAAYDPAPRRPLGKGERLGAAAFGLVLFGLLGAEVASSFSPAKLSLLFVLLFWVPMLFVHEFGHALVARLCGWGVHEMVLGFGPELARLSVGQTRVVLRLVPVEGYVVPVPSSLERARLKNALIYFGGPGAELLVAGALALWLGPEMFQRSEELGVIALQSAALAAVLGAVFTLVPHSAAGGASDGLGILLSASLSPAHFAYRMARPVMRDAERLIDADRADEALAQVRDALARYPDNPVLPVTLARCLGASGEVEAATAELERLRQLPEALDLVEGERLHAAARVVLDTRDFAFARHAEQACRAALERVPEMPEYLVTLGALVLQQGRFDEAEAVLQRAFKHTRDSLIEDRCLVYLALCARGGGRARDAELFESAFRAQSDARRLHEALARGAP